MANHKITIYSTENCPWCHKTKDWLNAHKFKFTDKDVGEDSDAAAEMVEKSGQRGVPVLDIDGKIIVGFNEPAIKKSLGVK